MRIYSVNVEKEGESEIETENRAKVNTRWTAKAARVVHVDCGQMCPRGTQPNLGKRRICLLESIHRLIRERLTEEGRICSTRNYLKMWKLGCPPPLSVLRYTCLLLRLKPILYEKGKMRQVAQHQQTEVGGGGDGNPPTTHIFKQFVF